jgi:hypothetical protein
LHGKLKATVMQHARIDGMFTLGLSRSEFSRKIRWI